MTTSLTGMSLNNAYKLLMFKSDTDASNWRLRSGDGAYTSPISVSDNTTVFSTADPASLTSYIPSGFGGIRSASFAGTGSAALVGTNTAGASSSGDSAQLLLSSGSVRALPAAVAGKAAQLASVRKTVTTTATTALDQFQVIGLSTGTDSTTDRIIESAAYTDSANTSNSYKEFKFGGYGASFSDSGQMQFRFNQGTNVGYFQYSIDNRIDLGQASTRFRNIFASNSTISTSDARLKTEIQSIPDAVLDAWEKVPVRMYKMIESVQEKGAAARWHLGRIAQEIVEVFEAAGLDATEYGVLCYDAWEDTYDIEGNLVQAAGERYSLRYEEAAMLDTAVQMRKLGFVPEEYKGINAAG